MENSSINQLISDLSRDLVKQVVPQEMPLFRATSEVFFQNPSKLMTDHRAKDDDMLGFGPEEAVVLLTPAIFTISQQVVQYIMEQVKNSVQGQGAILIDESVKKMFRKFSQSDKVQTVPLTTEQLAEVRKIAIKKARQFKLSEDHTKLLADAIIGSLAIN